MMEVTDALMVGLLKRFHLRFGKTGTTLGEVTAGINDRRGPMVSMKSGIHNIHGILARHDNRLDRIGKRLETRELAEA